MLQKSTTTEQPYKKYCVTCAISSSVPQEALCRLVIILFTKSYTNPTII